jgi:hypothetical protein
MATPARRQGISAAAHSTATLALLLMMWCLIAAVLLVVSSKPALAVQYQIVYVPVTVVINGKAVVIRRPVVRPVAVQRFALSVTTVGGGTVTSSPEGISCGADCTEPYAAGTTVTLTAAAGNGASFGGWSGDCAGSSLTCSLAMSQARSATATFVTTPVGGAPTIGGCPMFPDKAIFNTRIDDRTRFPVHAQNAAWITSIGATRRFHADWGMNDNPQQFTDYYGIPYNIIDGTAASTTWPLVSHPNGYPDESDCAVASGSGFEIHQDCTTLPVNQRRFPFPLDSRIKLEGGACNDPDTCGDRHVLVVEQGRCRLWESWLSYKVNGAWTSGGGAAWDLRSYAMRPDGWTSSDAAGLPILPLVARVDEASAGEIRHALRVTFRDSVLASSYVWPGRHRAGNATAGGIPFGALLRLRADFVIPATWTTQAQALARAMQRYGLYVSDIGSDLYVQGEPSAQWSESTIAQIQTLQMTQFEFVDISAVPRDPRFSADSYQGAW